MALSRVSWWSSAALHGVLLGALAVGSASVARHAPTLPPLVTIDCSDAKPTTREGPPPCETPNVEIEPTMHDELPIETREIEAPPVPPPDPATTPVAQPAERTLPKQLDPAFATTRLRTATPKPAPTPPTMALPPRDTDAARILTPLPGNNPPPEYPAIARRRGWQGTVVVAITCDADGAVTDATIVRSSGHVVLDDAALAAVRRWRFVGGPGRSEQPVEFRLATTGA